MKKYRDYLMNRNYYIGQQIDCNCFHLDSSDFSLSLYKPTTSMQPKYSHKAKMSKQNSVNSSYMQKMSTKTSLKRRKLNTTLDPVKLTETKDACVQTKTPRNQAEQNEKYPVQANKENRIIQYVQQPVKFQPSLLHAKIQKQQLQHILTHYNLKPNQIHTLLKTDKSICVSDFSTAFKKEKGQNIIYEENAMKILQTNEPDWQSRTVKKKLSALANKTWEVEPTLTAKCIQDQGKNPFERVQNIKRVSLRPTGLPCSSKKLNKMCPNQIESHQSDTSGYQSQVLERGRFTWAPPSLKSFRDVGFPFHARQQSGFSKIPQISGSREYIKEY